MAKERWSVDSWSWGCESPHQIPPGSQRTKVLAAPTDAHFEAQTTCTFLSNCDRKNIYKSLRRSLYVPPAKIQIMNSSLLHPPAHLPPAVALQLSQQAPSILRNSPSSISSYSLSSLWSAAETPELWTTYENLMLSCLRTGDEQSAHFCLERLTERFGADNERLMALKGLFQEAIANDDAALKQVLEQYDSILANDPGNMVGFQKLQVDLC
jgi:hypothetical protein